jgi:hypothetical protein
MLSIFSIFAACLLIASSLYYVWLVGIKRVRPSLSGTMVFLLSTGLGGFSTLSKVGWQGGIVPIIGALLNAVILILILKNKHHGGWSARDSFLISLGLLGALGWWIFDEPWVALLASLCIDVFGYWAVILKMDKHPGQEDDWAWGLAGLAYLIPLIGFAIWVENVKWHEHAFAFLNAFFCIWVTIKNRMQSIQLAQGKGGCL